MPDPSAASRNLTPSSPRDEDRQRDNQRVHPDDAGLAFENVERNRQDHDGCQPEGSQWRQPRRYASRRRNDEPQATSNFGIADEQAEPAWHVIHPRGLL